MSDFLALDWEHQQVCGLDAEVTKAGTHIRRAFLLKWPEGKSPTADAPAAGGWLNEQFQSLGLTAKRVLVTLPREDAVVRVLEVPNLPDGELPDVVRFQAAAKSTRPLDTQLLDFLPLPPREGVAGREVLVVTIGRELIDTLRVVLSRTGCELAGISLTAPAMVELIARLAPKDASSPNAVELTIIRHEQRVEISLLRQRGLLLTHSARLPDDAIEPDRQRQAVVAEVNRSLVALKRQHPELTLSRAWLWGDAEENSELGEVIGKRFNCEVKSVDPLTVPGITFDGPDSVGAHALFTGPVGLLLQQVEPLSGRIDFLHPRQAVVPRDLRRVLVPAVAAAVLLLMFGAWGVRASRVSGLQDEITKTRDAIKTVDTQLKSKTTQDSVKSAESIQKWVDQRVVWLDRFNELSQNMQGTDRRYLTKVTAQPGSGGALGTLRGSGFAKDRDDIEELNTRLTRNDVVVLPHEIQRPGSDGDYPFRFDLDISWRPTSKDLKKDTKPATKKN